MRVCADKVLVPLGFQQLLRSPIRRLWFAIKTFLSDYIPDVDLALECLVDLIIKPAHLADLCLYLVDLKHLLELLLHFVEVYHIQGLHVVYLICYLIWLLHF